MRHRHLLFGDAQGGFAANPTLRSKFSFYADLTDEATTADAVAGNNLTDNGGVIFAFGGIPAGRSQYVAASLQFLSRATFGAVEPVLDQSYCMAAWVYLDALTSNMPVVTKWRPVNNFEYLLQLNGTSQMRMLVRNAANNANVVATSPTTLTTGTWNFFVVGFDAAAAQVYISANGGARTNTAATQRIGGTAEFRIGSSDAAIYMDGWITRVGFGRFVPTAAEITHLFNAGAGRLYSEITI